MQNVSLQTGGNWLDPARVRLIDLQARALLLREVPRALGSNLSISFKRPAKCSEHNPRKVENIPEIQESMIFPDELQVKRASQASSNGRVQRMESPRKIIRASCGEPNYQHAESELGQWRGKESTGMSERRKGRG